MKRCLVFLAALLSFAAGTATAQSTGQKHPGIDAPMSKLFGDNSGFSAEMEIRTQLPSGGEVVMPGKIVYLDGKSRFEMDMAETKGLKLPPHALSQMKQMGMRRIISITLNQRNVTDVLYPDIKAYIETLATPGISTDPADYNAQVTELGPERTGGHKCVKDRVVVKGPSGFPHEYLVWDAIDLNQFPLKIETAAPHGMTATLIFKDVKLERPEAGEFEVPPGYIKYDDEMALIRSRMPAAH